MAFFVARIFILGPMMDCLNLPKILLLSGITNFYLGIRGCPHFLFMGSSFSIQFILTGCIRGEWYWEILFHGGL